MSSTSRLFGATALLGASMVCGGIGYVVLPNWAWIVAVLWLFREVYFHPTVYQPLPIPELVDGMDPDVGPVTEKTRRTCVVTGASGFLARHLITHLVETNAYDEIRAVDIIPPHYKFSQVVPIVANITDADAALKFTKGAGVVFHVASLIDLRDHQYRAHRLWNVNVVGASNIVNACIRNGVERLVYTSSFASVIGANSCNPPMWTEEALEHVMPEDLPSLYGKTKRMAELRVMAAHGLGRLRTIALRPCVPFGPGDKLQTHRVASEQILIHTTNGLHWSSYIYCKNWALWHKLAADKLLDIPEHLSGKAFFIDNGGEDKDGIISCLSYRHGVSSRRKKNPIRAEYFMNKPVQWAIFLFNAFFDWYTAGHATWDIFMFNKHAFFFTVVEAPLDCSKLAKLIGYKKRFSITEAYDDTAKELDL